MKRRVQILPAILGLFLVLLPAMGAARPAAPVSDQIALELVGYMGDLANGLAIAGDYAYLAIGRELAVLDISDPANLHRAGYTVLPERAEEVAIAGSYGYVLSAGHLYVVNLANPTSPQQMGSCSVIGFALDVSGSYAYVVGWDGFHVVNIADPNAPFVVTTGSTAGVDIAVSGSHAYVAGGNDGPGLQVVDISDPQAPVEVGSLEASAIGVSARGSYVYLTDYRQTVYSRLRVVDVSDPAHPQETGYAAVFGVNGPWGNIDGVYVSGNYAYVAGALMSFGNGKHYGGIDIVDISDPAHPAVRESYLTDEMPYPHAVAVSGPAAFVTDSSGGLRAVDVSDPNNPTLLAAYRGVGGSGLVVAPPAAATYAYLAGLGLHIVDVSDPTLPFLVGRLYTDQIGRLNGGDQAGSHAYLTSIGSLWIVDVSDPAHPSQASTYGAPGQDVVVAGNHAYMVGYYTEDLYIVDVSDPVHPGLVTTCDIPGQGQAVYISDTLAYLAGSLGLWVLDVADPANPQEEGYCEFPYATNVQVSGRYAYVPTYDYQHIAPGLTVVDVADPANPTVVGSCTLPIPPRSFGPAGAQVAKSFVSGDLVFVVEGRSLWAVDVSNPAGPHAVGIYTSPGYVSFADVYAAGDTVYAVADGLYILQVTTPILEVDPPALSFLAEAGGNDPAAHTLRVDASGGSITWTATVSPTAGWLEVTPVSGTTPAGLSVTAHVTGLSMGLYDTQLVVASSAGVRESPQAIPITLRVVEEVRSVYLPVVLRRPGK